MTAPSSTAAGAAPDFRRAALVHVTVIVTASWAGLWWWSTSASGRYLDHEIANGAGLGVGAALFTIAWVLMLTATMLPGTYRLVGGFTTIVRRRADRRRLLGLLLLGYLAVWTAVGVAALASDTVVHDVVHRVAWLEHRPWVISATTLAIASAYQFSSLKDRCLRECRSPLGFIVKRWHGVSATRESFAIGAAHGRFCVGCCGALMLVMFGIGMGNLGWMLALGAMMAVEKVAPWGPRVVAPVGVALAVAAVATVAVGI